MHNDHIYENVKERLVDEYDLDGRAAKSELGKLAKRVEELEAGSKAKPKPNASSELGKLVKRIEELEQNAYQAKSEPEPKPEPDDTAPPARRATT